MQLGKRTCRRPWASPSEQNGWAVLRGTSLKGDATALARCSRAGKLCVRSCVHVSDGVDTRADALSCAHYGGHPGRVRSESSVVDVDTSCGWTHARDEREAGRRSLLARHLDTTPAQPSPDQNSTRQGCSGSGGGGGPVGLWPGSKMEHLLTGMMPTGLDCIFRICG